MLPKNDTSVYINVIYFLSAFFFEECYLQCWVELLHSVFHLFRGTVVYK